MDEDSDDPNDCHRLKDPRTGHNFDYETAMKDHVVFHPDRSDFLSMIKKRLSLGEDEATEFLPEEDSEYGELEGPEGISNFAKHIRLLAAHRKDRHDSYVAHVVSLQNQSRLNLPTYSASIPESTTPVDPPSTNLRSNRRPGNNIVLQPHFPSADDGSDSGDSISTPRAPEEVDLTLDDAGDTSQNNVATITQPSDPTTPTESASVNVQTATQPNLPSQTSVLPSSTNNNPVSTQIPRLPTTSTVQQSSTSTSTSTSTPTLEANRPESDTPRNTVMSTASQRTLPPIPVWTSDDGAMLITSLLALAKSDGFENTFVTGKRTKWFQENIDGWFQTGGFLCRYRKVTHVQLMRRVTPAEKMAKELYARPEHQRDNSGNRDESTLPHFVKLFFEYFDFKDTHRDSQARERVARARNIRVNRSIIGQQAALSSNNTPTLLPTVAPPRRTRGTGDIADEIVVEEVTAQAPPPTVNQEVPTINNTDSSISDQPSTPSHTATQGSSQRNTPRRRVAPNDARFTRNQRTRHYNRNVSGLPTLPPSTSMSSAVNIDRMESGYRHIAESINNLAYQQRIRRGVDIMNDLLRNVERRSDLISEGADPDVIATYDLVIADLREERIRANLYDSYFSNLFQNVVNNDPNSAQGSASEENTNSDSR